MYLLKSGHTFVDWPDKTCHYGALILFFAGCDFGCKGCHNIAFKEHRKDHHTPSQLRRLVEYKGHSMPSGRYEHVILSGGDPLSELNYPDIKQLVEHLPEYKIMIYTGQEVAKVKQLDIEDPLYYKCGKFIQKQYREPGHRDGAFYLASPNQVLLNQEKEVISVDGVYRYA